VMAPRDDPWISCLYQLDTVVRRMFQRGDAPPRSESREERRLEGESTGLKTRHYTDGRPRKAVPTKTSKPGGVKPPLQKNREMCRGRSIPRSADCARNDAVTTRTRCCAHGAQLAASLQ